MPLITAIFSEILELGSGTLKSVKESLQGNAPQNGCIFRDPRFRKLFLKLVEVSLQGNTHTKRLYFPSSLI